MTTTCDHCDRTADGLFMLPTGEFYLCQTCNDNALDFVGDPTAHQWETVSVCLEGRGAASTYAVERCDICRDLRVDETVRVVEVVEDPDRERAEVGDAEPFEAAETAPARRLGPRPTEND